jgi:hypothetical protein
MAQSGKDKLRVGLLIDGFDVPAWQYAMLDQIQKSPFARIELVVLNGHVPARRSWLERLWSNRHGLVHTVYRALDSKLFRSNPNAFAPRSAAELLADVPLLTVQPQRTRNSDSIEDPDVETIQGYALDVLIRFGFRILRGRILGAASSGVWSYHHGDNDITRGGPAGFWEVVDRHPTTGAVLQQLTPELDNGVVLYKSHSRTDRLSVERNRNNYYWKALSFIPRCLRQLHDLGRDEFFERLRSDRRPLGFYSRRLYRRPSNRESLWLLAKHFLRNAARMIESVFYFEQWILMFDIADDLSTSCWKFRRIVPPKDRYWADPNAVYKDGKYYIFIEEFSYRLGKAHIAVITMDEDGHPSPPQTVLEPPYHLSYPFVFEWQGEHYMLPETAANRTIEVYRCVAFPHSWQLATTLMENIQAVDTTLFRYGGKWWLFTNLAENQGASTWDELFLFYSDSPLSRQWTPHPKNPIVSDVRRARPAGRLFEYKGELYRPSQDSSRSYGYALKINRVIRLTETEYEEREADSIEPNWDRRLIGVHTFVYEHGLTMIDARMKRFRL